MNLLDGNQGRLTFEDGSKSPSNYSGVLKLILDSTDGTVSLTQTAGWGVRRWTAKLPAVTWNGIVAALKADGFPRQPIRDKSHKLPGAANRTLMLETGNKIVRILLDPESGAYPETATRLLSIVSQITTEILGGTVQTWWVEGTGIEDVSDVRD